MARVRFSFSRQKSKAFGYIARPIIRLALRAGGGEVFETTALLDSGADISMLSPSVARIMGINLRKGRRRVLRGLGGEIEAYVHRVHFNIGALHFHARVAFPRVEIPNIIGRLDVMKAVDVIFRDERQVTLASAT